MFPRRDILKGCSLAALLLASVQGAQAQEAKTALFKVVTTKDEIMSRVIALFVYYIYSP